MSEIALSFGGEREIKSEHTAQIIEFPRVDTAPIQSNYAEHPLWQDFNVPEILRLASIAGNIQFGEQMYLVDFASQKRPDVDEAILGELDYNAHVEADATGELLLYYRGDGYGEGLNRSFCVWRSMESAKLASQLPLHRMAAEAADELYAWYQVTMRQAQLDESPAGFAFGMEIIHSTDGSNHLSDAQAA